MFQVGDKVVYPMHGAGIIEAIEEQEVLGVKKKYFVLKMPVGDMTVMVPQDRIDEIGLRQIVSSEQALELLEFLEGKATGMAQNWNRRYRANVEKIRTGDIFAVGEVVRNLTLRDQERGLSTGEKKLLNNARQILVSELVLAQDRTEEEVLATLDSILHQE